MKLKQAEEGKRALCYKGSEQQRGEETERRIQGYHRSACILGYKSSQSNIFPTDSPDTRSWNTRSYGAISIYWLLLDRTLSRKGTSGL